MSREVRRNENRESLLSGSYLILPKRLLCLLGSSNLCLLMTLLDKENTLEHFNKLPEDGFFYYNGSEIEKDAGISRREREKAIEFFKTANVIESIEKDMPRRLHYRILHDNLSFFLEELRAIFTFNWRKLSAEIEEAATLTKQQAGVEKLTSQHTEQHLKNFIMVLNKAKNADSQAQVVENELCATSYKHVCKILQTCLLLLANMFATSDILSKNILIIIYNNNTLVKSENEDALPEKSDTRGFGLETYEEDERESLISSVKEKWNSLSFTKKINKISDERLVVLNKRIDNHPDPEYWDILFAVLAKQTYLSNEEWFSFNWMIKSEENMSKILNKWMEWKYKTESSQGDSATLEQADIRRRRV